MMDALTENDRLIFKPELQRLFPASYTTIWSLMREGKFPLSLRVGGRVAWRESEVRQWLASLPRSKLKPVSGAPPKVKLLPVRERGQQKIPVQKKITLREALRRSGEMVPTLGDLLQVLTPEERAEELEKLAQNFAAGLLQANRGLDPERAAVAGRRFAKFMGLEADDYLALSSAEAVGRA